MSYLNMILYLFIIFSPVFVYMDASKNRIGKTPEQSFFNISAGSWGIAVLLVWIIAFPVYLIKRKALINKAQKYPIESKNKITKTIIFILISFFLIFIVNIPDYYEFKHRKAEKEINAFIHAINKTLPMEIPLGTMEKVIKNDTKMYMILNYHVDSDAVIKGFGNIEELKKMVLSGALGGFGCKETKYFILNGYSLIITINSSDKNDLIHIEENKDTCKNFL